MSTNNNSTDPQTRNMNSDVLSGGLAGLMAGVVFGLMLQLMSTPVITVAIPALYTFGKSAVLGWIIHLIHSFIFGLLYIATIQVNEQIEKYANDTGSGIVVGLVYGLLVWIIAAVIVMPIWLNAVNFANPPPLPNISPLSLVGHLVYGLILGIMFPVVKS